ncbi:hypothetical protein ABC347_10985 [Sphingomonas sp. 1P06PA]|uniref:hypothetical protein n=1 Tax=Sphingomonas sp. 1P06PA TaxID=554121 RepID=UPI0039A561EC
MAEALVSVSGAAVQAAIPVATGFTWTTAAVGLLNLLVGGVLVAIIRSRPALKKIANEREANLLSERAEEMREMRERMAKLEAQMAAKDAQHDAERASDRHRINNLSQCLDMLLGLIEQDPKKAAAAAARVKAMREKQMEAEALEKAAIHAAAIAATGVAAE